MVLIAPATSVDGPHGFQTILGHGGHVDSFLPPSFRDAGAFFCPILPHPAICLEVDRKQDRETSYPMPYAYSTSLAEGVHLAILEKN